MKRQGVVLLGAFLVLQCSGSVFAQTGSNAAPSTPQSGQASAKVALLGQPLSEAVHSEFFTFFHFSQTQDLADSAHPGMSLKMFGTSGTFKGDVTLLISTKLGDEKILAAALILRRDFVDTQATAQFARDVVKSFLELSPGIDSSDLAQLHAAVWTGCSGAAEQNSAAPCGPDGAKSPGYLTFLGKQEKCKIARPGGYVMLQNSVAAGTPVLFVEMRDE